MEYRRCEGCGNYFIPDESNSNPSYCSPECEIKYVRCTVCGNYFEKPSNTDDENYVCCERFTKIFKEKTKYNTLYNLRKI